MPLLFRFTSWFTPSEYVSNIAHNLSKVMGAAQPLILSALVGVACYGIGSALDLEPEEAYAEMLATLGTKVLGDAAIGAVLSGSIAFTSAVKGVGSLLAKETDQALVEKLTQTWEIPWLVISNVMQDLAFKTRIALLITGIMPNALRVLAGKAPKNIKAPIITLQIANGLFIFAGDHLSPQVTFACGTVTAASALIIGVNQIRQLAYEKMRARPIHTTSLAPTPFAACAPVSGVISASPSSTATSGTLTVV